MNKTTKAILYGVASFAAFILFTDSGLPAVIDSLVNLSPIRESAALLTLLSA